MDTFHAAAATLLDWLLETSVQVAVLVLLVGAAQLTLRRWLTPRWRYGLWLLVLVRLMLPTLPPSPVSVFNVSSALTSTTAGRAPVEPVVTAFVPAPLPTSFPTALPTSTPPPTPPSTQPPPQPPALVPIAAESAPPPATSRTLAGQTSKRTAPAPELAGASAAWPTRTRLAALWLGVALLLTGWAALRQLVFVRRLRRGAQPATGRAAALLAECASSAGVRRMPTLLRTDLVGGPALTGVLRPRLLVPGALLDGLGDAELRHVFRHELAHLRAGDVLLNWLIAAVQAVHWFNPFVWFAFARLRTSRESARDWTALAGESAEARREYGQTLIRLLEGRSRHTVRPALVGILEGRHDMRRRITMIAKFDRGSRKGLVTGALAVAVLGGVAFTGAMMDDAVGQEDPVRGGVDVEVDRPATGFARTVRVERRGEAPRWKADVQRKLATKVSVNFVDTPLTNAIEYLSNVAALNMIVGVEAQDAAGEGVSLEVSDVPADRVLRLLLRQVGLGYSLTGEAVYVDHPRRLPDVIEQRFYDITDLVQPDRALAPPDAGPEWMREREEELTDELVRVVSSTVAPDAWEEVDAQLVSWKKLLVVHHTAAVHAQVEHFLNLLLNAGEAPPRRVPQWRREVDAKLAENVSLSFVDAPLGDAMAYIQSVSGVPVLVANEDLREEPITIKLEDVTRRQALEWIARMARTRLAFVDGAVILTQRPPNEVAVYPVRDILTARTRPDDDGNPQDELLELLMTSVEPISWEETGYAQYWNGHLIVAQSEDVHPKIAKFFETLRRALK